TTTITFDDLKTALADQKTGSDLDCSTAPRRVFLWHLKRCKSTFLFCFHPAISAVAYLRIHLKKSMVSLPTSI
ncbi:hypothetical protein, partial [uncultured Agathobaculum sp.]|uniref:hypothetical protein n=1 Tax=uncultured Agathobaculum sp. TaxID=2048140 RepID=UPI003209E535